MCRQRESESVPRRHTLQSRPSSLRACTSSFKNITMGSDQLQWLLLKNWTSFTVKGQGTPVFTKEPGNLMNVHSPVYSGLLSGGIHVKQSKNGDFTINHRKQDASRHHVNEGRESQPVKRKAGLHRAVETAVGSAKASDRPELSRLAAARIYNLSASKRARHGRRKAAPAPATETKTEA